MAKYILLSMLAIFLLGCDKQDAEEFIDVPGSRAEEYSGWEVVHGLDDLDKSYSLMQIFDDKLYIFSNDAFYVIDDKHQLVKKQEYIKKYAPRTSTTLFNGKYFINLTDSQFYITDMVNEVSRSFKTTDFDTTPRVEFIDQNEYSNMFLSKYDNLYFHFAWEKGKYFSYNISTQGDSIILDTIPALEAYQIFNWGQRYCVIENLDYEMELYDDSTRTSQVVPYRFWDKAPMVLIGGDEYTILFTQDHYSAILKASKGRLFQQATLYIDGQAIYDFYYSDSLVYFNASPQYYLYSAPRSGGTIKLEKSEKLPDYEYIMQIIVFQDKIYLMTLSGILSRDI